MHPASYLARDQVGEKTETYVVIDYLYGSPLPRSFDTVRAGRQATLQITCYSRRSVLVASELSEQVSAALAAAGFREGQDRNADEKPFWGVQTDWRAPL